MKVDKILDFKPASELGIPMFGHSVSAGIPIPTEDYTDGEIDLNKHLVKHPNATYFVRVSGDSMIRAGIFDGAILIIDCAIEAKSNDIVIARLNGDLTVKRYCSRNNQAFLLAENPKYPTIEITPEMDFEILGVAIHVIHSLQ